MLAAVEPTGLDEQAARLLERTLRDFRRSGVDRSEEVRDRLRELAERATATGQEFSRNIRDDVRSIRIAPERLAGLPQDFIDSHPAGDDGLVTLSTDYPDVVPFRTFARDAEARRELLTEFLNRAWPQNDALLGELLDLRAEQAKLLGYDSWPDFDAEVKMIGTSAAIAEFIERITTLAEPAARRDFDVLLKRRPARRPRGDQPRRQQQRLLQRAGPPRELRRRRPGGAPLLRLRTGAGRPARRHRPAVRRRVRTGTGRGSLAPGRGRIRRADGDERLGRIYLDLHPRAGKFKHAAQFDVVPGIAGRQLPEGTLVCNLPRGLMEHSDVVTLFHEFGHLVHHVLGGEQHWARFSGVATEWDFVEAPSQMLEEWAWDPQILASFALDADGNPIPAELVERMRAAKEFGKGYFARTQMFYAALSYQLHLHRPDDITATVRELQAKYDLFDYIDDTHFHASFGHLEGYTSAYYTYMWSLVIAKDMFSAFDPKDMFDPTVAHRYRDEILARGGNADAADLVTNFLGRPYSFEAFGHWLAEAPARVS